MVEFGNGKRFFFDFGSDCVRKIIPMAVPLTTVNDIFFTHLHVDHYADLSHTWPKLPHCRARLRCRMSGNQTYQPLIMTQR
jgi:ribonuclease Z